jgi:DNA-binding response OmpR family regulator
MHLPDLSGSDLCRRFKKMPEFGEPRVVLLARPDSGRDHAEAVRASADEVLFKPLERDSLVASVRRLTDFEPPRGQPRAHIEQRVSITAHGARVVGKLINVSRGGLFVEVPVHFGRREEIALSFSLDGNGSVVSPTAQVIWCDSNGDGRDGVGLRFLDIDRQTISKLEHYVSDHFPPTSSLPG